MKFLAIDFRRVRWSWPRRRDWLWLAAGVIVTLAVMGTATLLHRATVPVHYQTAGITIPWLPATVRRWQQPIDETARRYNVDPNLVAIIMTLESGGYAKADSGQAQGLMQVSPLTGRDIAAKYLQRPVKTYNLFDPPTSIEFGTAYLAYLRSVFGDWQQGPTWDSTVELLAAGYNGGPGAAYNLQHGRGLTDTQTVVYSRDAFNMWRERHAKDSPTYDRWLERGGSILINLAKTNQ